MRTSNFSAIEDALLKWFKMHRAINIPLNGPILQNKANDFARLLNVPDFNCSASWIHRFCQRNSIVFGKISGEDKSVPPGICKDWIKKVWPTLRTGYTDEQIFNADETGLFYRLTPDRTYRFKGEKCTGGKLSKDRITVLVAANMTGSEKRKLVVIGKSKNPRCLKNVKNLPVVYESNKRAWMASDLFEKIIRNWETELRKKGKKILLLVDNCPAHPVIENLEFIKLVFLPPNTTSKLQPLDQGVIRCLKVYFRKLIILHTLTSIEKKIEPKISIFDAIILISRSWDCVSSLTIQNCFKHAGFIDDPSDNENDVSPVASEIVTWAQSLQLNANDTEVEEFINLDEQIEVYGQLTDEEIALPAANIPEDDDEEEEEEVEQPPTIDDAYKTASYGKKTNGTWYPPDAGSRGWSKPPVSRKPSVTEQEPATGGKPSSGRVIRIINNHDHTVQCRVLLNLRTSQPFEDVVEDLGQVLKMSGARRMFTVSGQEVRSFSQLRNEFSDVDTFYLGNSVLLSPVRRSRSRGPVMVEPVEPVGGGRRRARSKSRPRALYIEPEVVRPNNGPYQQVSPYQGRAMVEPVEPEGGGRQRARSKSRPRTLYIEADVVRHSNGPYQQMPPYQDYSLLEVLKEEPVRLTIKGSRRTVFPPLHHAPQDNAPPEKRLVLDWVYGYRGTDSKRNLWVLPSGELLYFVAAVAVLYDRDEEAQRHYVGHTEDIQCMDVHPSRELVASGQRAGRNRKTQAHIRIWSTETLLTLYVFGMGEFEVGVSAVAFSQLNGGSYVLAVDGGRERILSVWQWQWGHLLGKVATLQEELTGAAFHPLDDNLLITHGKGHLTFWTRRKDGYFEKTDIIKPPSRTNITCLQFEQEGDVVTADGDGFITIYSVDSEGAYFVRMEFEAHNKGISSLMMLSEGTLLSGGEKDRKIIAWDSLQNYKKIIETKLPEIAGGVRSIYPQRPGRNDGNIYVGTTRNNIMEGSMQRRFNQVVFGHSRQLWGIAVHPDDELFATAGHDKNIALWKKHKLVWTMMTPHECVSLAFHPFGAALAAGATDGHLVVLNGEAGTTVATVRVCGSALNCLSYNPAGDMLAIGSQNGSVYLFRVTRDGYSYKKINKIRGSQPLMQLDWSTDGNYLQTVTAEYDLLFWDVKALTAEKSPITMKDVKWYTQTCTVGFLVAGVWNNRYYPMTSLVSTVSRSAAHDLLVTGDVEGYLRLFRYPCISAKAEYNEEKVYSMALAGARFLYNDRNVVTVGGSDAALMLWEVVDE